VACASSPWLLYSADEAQLHSAVASAKPSQDGFADAIAFSLREVPACGVHHGLDAHATLVLHICFNDERRRAIVDQVHLHVRSEFSGCDPRDELATALDEVIEQPVGA
jgi:hypothetical protein